MQKILAKELGRGNIRLSISLWRILTTYELIWGFRTVRLNFIKKVTVVIVLLSVI